ncbi:Sp1 transcription factor, isoform CRA_a [Homo sapiens]|uniref:Sp1 transcription factor, isoform CRA_a n=1 Tax=Homo sapiens TaxID=9606 RepID=B2R4Y6_HUMAN|nr:Sp1 transcription factor, isoform CRA_a [Homo sapiens]BAG34933.1 unnamed protein product [Homo sapiens]
MCSEEEMTRSQVQELVEYLDFGTAVFQGSSKF